MLLEYREKYFPTVQFVDVGGGIQIPYKPNERAAPLHSINAQLNTISVPRGVQVWLEPGRYIVAESGVILTRVTQLKHKGGEF